MRGRIFDNFFWMHLAKKRVGQLRIIAFGTEEYTLNPVTVYLYNVFVIQL